MHDPDPHSSAALGPGDSSDSGSDVAGTDQGSPDTDEDRFGTGEGHDAQGEDVERAADPIDGAIEGVDRIVDASEAGLGEGLDEAEQAEVDPVGRTPRRR